MKRSRVVTVVLVVLAATMMLGSVALGYNYKLYSESTPWYTTTISSRPGMTFYLGGERMRVATWSGSNPNVMTRWMYCIDVQTNFSQGQGSDLMGTPNVSSFPTVNPTINAQKWSWISWLVNNVNDAGVNGVNDSALQAAIWEIGSETTSAWDVATGSFFVAPLSNASAISTKANSYLAMVAGANVSANYAAYNNQQYMHDGQDFTWKQPQVPEIPAALLGPLGVSLLAVVRRRFRH